MNNNDHANHRPKDPAGRSSAEHRTVEFMCGGDWEISHGGPRKSAGRQGPVQMVTAATKAGTLELQCKTYEEYKSLMEAAAKSVGCSTYALPMVLDYFGKAPKRKEGDLIRNPAYDEKEFKALPKEQQTGQRERSMKYLQGPDGERNWWLLMTFIRRTLQTLSDPGFLNLSGGCNLDLAIFRLPSCSSTTRRHSLTCLGTTHLVDG